MTLWTFGNLIDFLTTTLRHDMPSLLNNYVMFMSRQHIQLFVQIQDDSGGKSNILGSDILGQCEKKIISNVNLM